MLEKNSKQNGHTKCKKKKERKIVKIKSKSREKEGEKFLIMLAQSMKNGRRRELVHYYTESGNCTSQQRKIRLYRSNPRGNKTIVSQNSNLLVVKNIL